MCCRVLVRKAGDEPLLQELLQEFKTSLRSSGVLAVVYDLDYEQFNVKELLNEKECLEDSCGLPAGHLDCIRVEDGCVAIYWFIDKRYIARVVLDVCCIFWRLLELRVTSLELLGTLKLSLKGRHVPYLIRDALLIGQDLIQQTEVFSHQFLALVEPTHPSLKTDTGVRKGLLTGLLAQAGDGPFVPDRHADNVSQSQQGEHKVQGRQQEAISQHLSKNTSTVSLPVQSALDTSMEYNVGISQASQALEHGMPDLPQVQSPVFVVEDIPAASSLEVPAAPDHSAELTGKQTR